MVSSSSKPSRLSKRPAPSRSIHSWRGGGWKHLYLNALSWQKLHQFILQCFERKLTPMITSTSTLTTIPRILTGVIKCHGDRADRIWSRNWTPGVVVDYQLLYKLHTDEVPASEVKPHMHTSQQLKLTDRRFSTFPMYVTSVRGQSKSEKFVLLSSLPTYWDSLLYKWRTVQLLRRRIMWSMRSHAKTLNMCTLRKWEES